MTNLHRALLDLFQSADGLLLPDEAVLQEISRKQCDFSRWNEAIVLQGLTTMVEFLQDLATENQVDLINSMEEMEWDFREKSQSQLQALSRNLPSMWELARHLSNWIIVFIPPVRALDLRGDMELISCLDSKDSHISTLAAIMLGHEEFNYLGSIEKFSEILNGKYPTTLRLEIGRLLYMRYRDPQVLRKETVPYLISSENQYDTIFESDVQVRRFLSYVRELVVWDIASQGAGPKRKWAKWWV
jgi:hypothetical protein